MDLKVIIVDDEPLAIAVIEGYLSRIHGVNVVASFSDGLPAFEFLQDNPIDIMFLDIEMPQLTGIELVRSLRNPPVVIITSANRDYAIEGFELNVADYILKPVTFERLLKAFSKAKELLSRRANDLSSNESEYLIFKESKRNVRIKQDDILYFESIKDYVKVVTASRTVITRQSIGSLEQMLDKDKFIRVHRSFIVAVNHVDTFSTSSIEVGDFEIPVGRLFKDEVVKVLERKK
ncbi:MAG TPA: DNA-binding response regulator [Bacteroidales bacterium]|nr:DNA-binding response regulator [Bacteroidales bacterium]